MDIYGQIILVQDEVKKKIATVEPDPGNHEHTTFSLEIRDAEHQAVLRLQQEEIIIELRSLLSAVQALEAAVSLNGKLLDGQTKITEMGLRLICLVPVTLCFLFIGSYFFYVGKVSETFFGTLLFLLMFPFMGQWIEKAFSLIPLFGNVLKKPLEK